MKTATNNNMIKEIEMAEIFKIEIVNGKKRVSRWGFFVNQDDGTYAVYKPEKPVCHVNEYFMIEEDGPGAIDIVNESEIRQFLDEIGDKLEGIAGAEVSTFTPCGWYYDTVV